MNRSRDGKFGANHAKLNKKKEMETVSGLQVKRIDGRRVKRSHEVDSFD